MAAWYTPRRCVDAMRSSYSNTLPGAALPPAKGRRPWRGKSFRNVAYQVVAVALIVSAIAWLAIITAQHMRERGIHSGFDFIAQPANFSIGESVIAFDSSESLGKALLVGLSNTIRVSLPGIVLATLLGTIVGVGRQSANWLMRGVCKVYVDVFRNIPLLLQLFIWYFVLTNFLPSVDAAVRLLPDVYLSSNGLQFVIPVWSNGHYFTLAGLAVGLLAAWGWRRFAAARRNGGAVRSGAARVGDRCMPVLWPSLALIVLCTVLGWLAGGAPHDVDIPEKTVINMVGGGSVTPEYLTVLLGLVMYTAAYIAEVVRGGIRSVPQGQFEACHALGLSRRQGMRLVRMPQALRVIIPPLTNQYLSLIKNSSLAVAVGYPDLVSISNTTMNQTGRAVECIAIVMACYLTLSLLTSFAMNVYNRRAKAWSN
jgi:general L-amino acid transport system permease protein